jgi:SAM-dependent methyltransferase
MSDLIDNDWVSETSFGIWFQGTTIWTRYVLTESLDELQRLAGDQIPTSPVILDVGCGEGKAFPLIEERFRPKRIVGIDIDPNLIQRARRISAKTTCSVELLNCSIATPTLATASFDIVLCHQSLHHVSDQIQALSEFHRLLKPGGMLLLSESCQAFTESMLVRLLFRHPEGNQRSAKEFINLVLNAGFKISPESISNPNPWWALPAMGLWDKIGLTRKKPDATQLCIAAIKS